MKIKDKDGRFICIKKTLLQLLRLMPDGTQFHGGDLKKECIKLHPEFATVYEETFIKTMRKLRKDYGFNIRCINGSESLYIKEAR